MKNPKKLGIWMDHSIAHLMEFTDEPFEVKTIESKFQERKRHALPNEEPISLEQKHKQYKYYKKLGEEIKNYCQVILFGPTDAKMELFNILSDDHRFVKIQVEIKETDMMTRSQLHSFVNEYFSVA
jgi:ADP-heptose:LPS heptosyltransferase